MDAIDTAIVDFSDPTPHLIAYEQYPIDPDTKSAIRKIDTKTPVEEVSRQDYLIGEMFAAAVNRILAEQDIPPRKIAAIGCHG